MDVAAGARKLTELQPVTPSEYATCAHEPLIARTEPVLPADSVPTIAPASEGVERTLSEVRVLTVAPTERAPHVGISVPPLLQLELLLPLEMLVIDEQLDVEVIPPGEPLGLGDGAFEDEDELDEDVCSPFVVGVGHGDDEEEEECDDDVCAPAVLVAFCKGHDEDDEDCDEDVCTPAVFALGVLGSVGTGVMTGAGSVIDRPPLEVVPDHALTEELDCELEVIGVPAVMSVPDALPALELADELAETGAPAPELPERLDCEEDDCEVDTMPPAMLR